MTVSLFAYLRSVYLIDDWVTWVSNPSNALAVAQLAAAGVTALATIALWRVTRVLAKETEALAKLTSQPFVVGSLESSSVSSNAFNLTLRNTGNATAFDIVLEITPPIPNFDGSIPSEKFIRRTVSMLPPQNPLTLQVAMGPDIHDKKFEAIVSWSRRPKEDARESLTYVFSPLDGFQGGVVTKSAHHIAEELEKIRKHIGKIETRE